MNHCFLLWCLSCEIYRATRPLKKSSVNLNWREIFVCSDLAFCSCLYRVLPAEMLEHHKKSSNSVLCKCCGSMIINRNAREQLYSRKLTEWMQFQKVSFASAKMKENATRLHMTDFSVLQSIVYHDTRRKSMWESGYDMNEQQHARNECQILTMCVLLCLNFFDGSSFFRRSVSATIQSKKLRGCWVMSVANGLAKRSFARSQCSTGWSGRKFNACLDFN